MRKRAKQLILRRIVARIYAGTTFITNVYLDHHSHPDTAWIRNIYILLSFYTELLLKAIYIYEKEYSKRQDLEKVLITQGHNLERIGKELGPDILKKYNIYNIKKFRRHQYKVVTDVGTFYVKDFVDIRYDFLTPRVRKLKGNEHEMFRIQIAFINRIVAFLNGPAWS